LFAAFFLISAPVLQAQQGLITSYELSGLPDTEQEDSAPAEVIITAASATLNVSTAKVFPVLDGLLSSPHPPAVILQAWTKKADLVPILRFSRVLFRHVISPNAP
jgi:hypothetical protein